LESLNVKINETIVTAIKEFEAAGKTENFWKKPIIKIISANDNNFESLKQTVSSSHLMPYDILPDVKSIICFFIPFHAHIVNSNMNGNMASEKWALAYIKTNELILKINNDIEILMEQNGYKTGKIPATHNFDKKTLKSGWSHRHIAYMAGIGTFGINNMLITEKGCCGRLGSILIDYELPVYENSGILNEKCLNKKNNSCGKCQKNCVAGAYTLNEFNRHKCYEQCIKNSEYHKNIGYADVCGKCLAGLPCSTKEPQHI